MIGREEETAMGFTWIDRNSWKREEYFAHYLSAVPRSYSMTVRLDVTELRRAGRKLYPTMLFALARAVNRQEEFRMSLDSAGRLGVFDEMWPSYTVFHPETETFSNLWTAYVPDYERFCRAYERDIADYGAILRMNAKPHQPPHTFPVSMVPWESFDSFQLHLPNGGSYLTPIFTMGRIRLEGGRQMLPLAVQVHHAVCDGYHVCRLIGDVRAFLEGKED